MTGERCDIIDDAINRYYQIIFFPSGKAIRMQRKEEKPAAQKSSDPLQPKGFLDAVEINLKTPCESLPLENMLESCKLSNLFL